MAIEILAYELQPDERVGCYYCILEGCTDDYGRGEAYLAGPTHNPCDGNANHICKQHLEPGVVICDINLKN